MTAGLDVAFPELDPSGDIGLICTESYLVRLRRLRVVPVMLQPQSVLTTSIANVY